MKKLIALLLMAVTGIAYASWDGVEDETGTKVMITSKRIHVRKGNTIEVFDYGDKSYHDCEIYRISSHGTDVKFEVYDKDTGENRIFIMQGTGH